MKKSFILVLALSLALGLAATTGGGLALAATGDLSPAPAFSDIAGHPGEADLTALGSLGVFTGAQGLGGPVAPNDAITRAQYCKVVVVAKGLTTLAQGLAGVKPQFTDANDIQSWAWGYVNAAVQAGIIGGYPDGSFKPNNPVKYSEALKMLVCAITGHKAKVDPALTWPSNYVFYGVAGGFAGDVTIADPGASCPRGDMARMLLATMKVIPLDPGGLPDPDGAILTSLGMNSRYWTGNLIGRTGGQIYLTTWMGPLSLAEKVYIVGAGSYEECAGTKVECIADTSRKIVFIHRTEGTSNSGIFKTLGADVGGAYIELATGQKFYYDPPHVHVELNRDTSLPRDETCLLAGDALLLNTDAGGKATAIKATRYDLIRARLILPPPVGVKFVLQPEDALLDVLPASGLTPARLMFPPTSPYWFYNDIADVYQMIGAVSLEVGSVAEVKINGLPATVGDLTGGDVIKAATRGAYGYLDKDSIVEIRATRNIADGVVTTNRAETDGGGTRYYVLLNIGGTIQQIQRYYALMGGCYLTADLIVGQRYKLARNEAGQLFYNIGFTTANPIVYVKGASVTGAPPVYSVTFDYQGIEQTLISSIDSSTWPTKFGRLTIDGATGQVTGFAQYAPVAGYTVAAVSGSGVTLQKVAPPGTFFGASPVVYRKSGGVVTYIGPAGLTTGWSVKAYLDGPSVPILIVYEP
jgi:hypothetical protein